MTELYFITTLIFIIILITLFRFELRSLTIKNKTAGEFILDFYRKDSFFTKKERKSIESVTDIDIWLFKDISEGALDKVNNNMNIVQKFALLRLIKSPFVKIIDDKAVLTELGQKVYTKYQQIDITRL